MKKVVLAYSGGLDTSCCIQWLRDKGFEVVCFSANLGSEFSPQDLRKRALASGAKRIYIKDLQDEFAKDYIVPALKAGACYEGKYLLATALGRPLIAQHLVEVATREKASFVAHGCTGKGNDQVRIEVTTAILGPKLTTIAPLREWELTSRESEIDYAKKHKLPIAISKDKIYSIDKNIWGVSIEGGRLEDIDTVPPKNSYYWVKPIEKVSNKVSAVAITFKSGVPVACNGKKMGLVALINRLNSIGAAAGVGRTDLIEDRVVGIKSREIYEAPAAWVLYAAHKELESLVLDRETIFLKESLALKYAQLVYQGLWFSQAKVALDGFVEQTQKNVTGTITLHLQKGNIMVAKRLSSHALYKKALATYGDKDEFNRSLAEGFIHVWGMPYKGAKQ